MKTLKILLLSILTAVVLTAAASAETINTIDQIEQTALLNNLAYKTAVLNVMKAENSLESKLKIDSSSLGLSASYTGDDSNFNWGASASLPVFEQLSISAAIDQDYSGTFGINISPLSHSDTVEQSRLSYNLKLAEAEDTAADIADGAVENYLSWTDAFFDYGIQQKIVDVKQTLYEDEKIRYEIGEADLDDVRDAFTAWSDSRTLFNTAFNTLQTAEAALYSTLNINPADFNIEPPAEADLFNLIEELDLSIKVDSLSAGESFEIISAAEAVKSLELQQNSTWIFEPDFSIGGNMTISTDDSSPSFTATAALSFGLDDWNADEIKEIETELEISRMRAVQTISAEELKLQQAITNAGTASISYEIAEVALEQAEELFNEAEFLYDLGEYSAAELEESMLQYEQSKNKLFAASADHYNALRLLLRYAE